MSAKYTASTIAKWFVAWANAEEADLSNLKLQKLLYYAQGHHVAKTGAPLFSDTIRAWSHGPVVPAVYHVYKQYGSADIPDDETFDWGDVDETTTQFLIQVWDTYGGYGAWKLRNMTHDESPWQRNFHDDGYNLEIPLTDLEQHFASVA
ncbi:Panacea domain-containing protein [Pseudonocardia sp. CA-142604]|uniref:Panacea domain-containing protein n=1 Tax=Pseudonocardia sp. CA-142604 TaxID=3240024 RepID=UPI003D924F40